jgi:hypothetical protein
MSEEWEIVQALANLFEEDDMEDKDAADFVDAADETFNLYLRARRLIEGMA